MIIKLLPINHSDYLINPKTYMLYRKNGESVSADDHGKYELFNNGFKFGITWIKDYFNLNLKFSKETIKFLPYLRFKTIKNSVGTSTLVPYFTCDASVEIDNKKFKVIPFNPMYAVSEDGEIYSFKNKKYLQPKLGVCSEYYNVGIPYSILDTTDCVFKYKLRTTPVHKIVGMCWVGLPNDYELIDHIDSNTVNNHYSNLRWVSPTSNIIKERYGTIDFPYLLRNVDTGEILKVKSLNMASKMIGRSRIRPKLSTLERGRIFSGTKGRFEIKFYTDTKDWYYKTLLKGRTPNIKITYPNGDEVYTTGNRETLSQLGCVRWRNAFDGIVSEAKEYGIKVEYIIKPISDRKVVFEAMNIETGEIKKDTSLHNLSRFINVPSATIYKYIRNNWYNYDLQGWLVRKETDKPWDVSNIKIKKDKVAVILECEDDKLEFTSILKASYYTLISAAHLTKCLKYNRHVNYNNKKWVIKKLS